MKLSATSSDGLPSNPPEVEKERRKEASGNARSGLGPPQRSRGSGSRPFPGESPTTLALARGRDPQGGAGGGRRPRARCTQAPPPPSPLGPGLPGSNRLSIQLPVARSPGRARPTPPGRSPGLDCTTFPTPAGGGGLEASRPS